MVYYNNDIKAKEKILWDVDIKAKEPYEANVFGKRLLCSYKTNMEIIMEVPEVRVDQSVPFTGSI